MSKVAKPKNLGGKTQPYFDLFQACLRNSLRDPVSFPVPFNQPEPSSWYFRLTSWAVFAHAGNGNKPLLLDHGKRAGAQNCFHIPSHKSFYSPLCKANIGNLFLLPFPPFDLRQIEGQLIRVDKRLQIQTHLGFMP